jgi:uncharacterized protein (DUF1778 family)
VPDVNAIESVPMKKRSQRAVQDDRLYLRVSSDLKKLIALAAKRAGHDNESVWIRNTLETAARRELEK